jgi:hypothetical protein
MFIGVGLSTLYLRATSHTRLHAHDHYTSSTLIGGKGGAGPDSLHTTLEGTTCMWMQDGCKVYTDSYMASNESCFMVTWTLFKNHLLEVSLTQNQKTMPLRKLTTVGLFYFYHVWGPAWIEIYWNSIWLRARSHMASHCTWGYTRRKLVHYNRPLRLGQLRLMLGKCIKISLWLSTRRFWIMTN